MSGSDFLSGSGNVRRSGRVTLRVKYRITMEKRTGLCTYPYRNLSKLEASALQRQQRTTWASVAIPQLIFSPELCTSLFHMVEAIADLILSLKSVWSAELFVHIYVQVIISQTSFYHPRSLNLPRFISQSTICLQWS